MLVQTIIATSIRVVIWLLDYVTAERSQVVMSAWMKAAIFGVAAIMTSACSVMQPHVDLPVDIPQSPVVFAGGLNPQLVRAKLAQQRYMDAVSDQALLTNSLAITAIPLSAAALAVGITNPGTTATRNFLTGAGVGVATTLGLGSFLVDRRRDAIYYNGARQIYCLALAISPLAIEINEFEDMRQDVEKLRSSLAEAAATGAQPTVIENGNKVFAAGRQVVRETAQAGSIFSNELIKINIVVNAQLASEDRNIGDIATTISAIQKNLPTIIAASAPGPKTQGGRFSSDVRLRRSVELVATWLAVYDSMVTATATKLQAAQCSPTTATSLQQAQPTVIVANGQSVTITPAGQGNTSGSGSVITVQPPPPTIGRRKAVPGPITSPEEMRRLRQVFLLTSTNATSSNSPAFRNKVRDFQHCLAKRETGVLETGVLTPEQKGIALVGTDECLPINAPSATVPSGPARDGSPTMQPQPPPIRRNTNP